MTAEVESARNRRTFEPTPEAAASAQELTLTVFDATGCVRDRALSPRI